MPRYFFDVLDGGLILDDEGADLPDVHAARDEAIKALPDILKSFLPGEADKAGREVSVTMRDEGGKPIFEATVTIETRWLTDR